MTIEPYEKDYFFNQCNPLIKSSLSQEQSNEVKRLLSLSMQCKDTKVTKINFNVWFFGFYFFTLYFGKEHRLSLRRFEESSKIEILFSFIGILFSFTFTLSMIIAIFMALYYVKTFAGIDIFKDSHLQDHF
mgnify:FL=1